MYAYDESTEQSKFMYFNFNNQDIWTLLESFPYAAQEYVEDIFHT